MKTLVLSISFFVLAVSPFTCSSELSTVSGREEQLTTTQQQVEVEIDPIVMPKKP